MKKHRELLQCTGIGTIIELVLRGTEEKHKRKIQSTTWEEVFMSENITQKI